jgi:hypothetical protein
VLRELRKGCCRLTKIIRFPRRRRVQTSSPPVAPPSAIVRWPEGLSGAAVVYPLGESDVETEEIRMRLEKVLSEEQVD